MGITVQQVGVLTCASRLCLRSLTRPSKLLDVELCWTQLRQVPELLYKKCHGSSPAVVVHHKHCCSYFGTAAIKHETRQQSSSTMGLQLQTRVAPNSPRNRENAATSGDVRTFLPFKWRASHHFSSGGYEIKVQTIIRSEYRTRYVVPNVPNWG